MDVRELIEEIVKTLVDHPEQVHCSEILGTQSCVLELTVAPDDAGKVIGKRGVHTDNDSLFRARWSSQFDPRIPNRELTGTAGRPPLVRLSLPG